MIEKFDPRTAHTRDALVDELYAHRAIYQRILHGPSSYATLTAVIGLVTERMRHRLVGARLTGLPPLAAEDRLVSLAAGVTWLFVQWRGGDCEADDSPQAMTERLVAVVSGVSGGSGERDSESAA